MRNQTEEQKEKRRVLNREYSRRKRLGLPTRTTPINYTTNNKVPTLGHEYNGVCKSCGMEEKCYKGLCAFCRSFANIHTVDQARSKAARAGASNSPHSFAKSARKASR